MFWIGTRDMCLGFSKVMFSKFYILKLMIKNFVFLLKDKCDIQDFAGKNDKKNLRPLLILRYKDIFNRKYRISVYLLDYPKKHSRTKKTYIMS